jgi:hypothetical protein
MPTAGARTRRAPPVAVVDDRAAAHDDRVGNAANPAAAAKVTFCQPMCELGLLDDDRRRNGKPSDEEAGMAYQLIHVGP